jgi:tetratricopeptide (TPR) repeat protein
MIEHGRVLLNSEDDLALRTATKDDPIAAMVTEGILDRELTTRHQVVYKIYHQRFAEALMAARLWARASGREDNIITTDGIAKWGNPPLTQNLIGALEYIVQERLLSKKRYSEAMLVLDKIDYQMSPQNSWLFTAGHIQSSVHFRSELSNVLASKTDYCRNAHQLGLGFIRLGNCQEALKTFESIILEPSAHLPPAFQAAALMYKALALNTLGQSREAYHALQRALPLARASPIEGNVHGNLASVKMKLLGMDRCCPHGTWTDIKHRVREVLLSPRLLSTYLDFASAIKITREYRDDRSTRFWNAARSHFIGVLGWHERAARRLDEILADCHKNERDAHCLLFINRYLGEVYSAMKGCEETALSHITSAKRYATEIGDAENIRQVDDLIRIIERNSGQHNLTARTC